MLVYLIPEYIFQGLNHSASVPRRFFLDLHSNTALTALMSTAVASVSKGTHWAVTGVTQIHKHKGVVHIQVHKSPIYRCQQVYIEVVHVQVDRLFICFPTIQLTKQHVSNSEDINEVLPQGHFTTAQLNYCS